MEIFGIGPLEFVLIVVIMLLVLGPKEMVATAGKIGRFIRQIVRSPMWGTVMQTSKEVRDLPNRIIREAGLEEDIAQIKQVAQTPAQMMNEATQQLKVEIEPIEIPKIPNPLNANAAGIPVIPPTSMLGQTPSATTITAAPAPLEVDTGTPLTVDTPEPAAPLTNTVSSPSSETSEGAQSSIPADAQLSSENARPLTVEPIELPVDIKNDLAPAPKRRTRKIKSEISSSVGESDRVLPASSSETTNTESLAPRKPRRPKAKPEPLETDPLPVIEPASPHENGRSSKNG